MKEIVLSAHEEQGGKRKYVGKPWRRCLAAILIAVMGVAGVVTALGATTINKTTLKNDEYSYVNDQTFSNGTVAVLDLNTSRITERGTAMATGNALTPANSDYSSYTYYTLPSSVADARTNGYYVTYGDCARYTDSSGNFCYYDVRVYFWQRAYGTLTADINGDDGNNAGYKNGSSARGAVMFTAADGKEGKTYFTTTTLMEGTGTSATSTYTVNMEFRFYKPGTTTEVSVNGYLRLLDLDGQEGYYVRNSGSHAYYATPDTVLAANADGFVVGAADVDTNYEDTGIAGYRQTLQIYFTSSSSSRLQIAYVGHKGLSRLGNAGAYYRIRYNGNGSTSGSTTNTGSLTITNATIKSNGFSKTGYSFAGWNTEADGSGGSYTAGQTVQHLVEFDGDNSGEYFDLYAQWTANTYTVTFYQNGGSGTSGNAKTQSFTYDRSQNLTTVSTLGYYRTGYTFSGWSTSRTGSINYTDGQNVKNLSSAVNGNVPLYAIWTGDPINITYNANGGTGTMSATSYAYGTTTSLRKCTFSRTGHYADGTGMDADFEFTGWTCYDSTANKWLYVNSSGTYAWYPEGGQTSGYTLAVLSDGADVTTIVTSGSLSTTERLICYAQWERGDGNWSLAQVAVDTDMFEGTTQIKGGSGTTFSSAHTDSSYARIDGGTGKPGYFTDK